MIPLFILICLQLVIAGIVIFALKRLLDRELKKVAIEKVMALKNNAEIKTIHVYSAKVLSAPMKQQLTSIIKKKFSNAQIVFESLKDLKGGLMIKFGDEVLDYSVSSRLENLWS